MTQIPQLLRSITKNGKDTTQNIVMCTVVSVDGNECVCQPIDDGEAEFQGVSLCAEDAESKFLITPVIDSLVGVAMLSDSDNTDYIVVLYSEIESIQLKGTQYGGLVKIEDLVEKLNNLENLVNDLITAYNSHTHSGVFPGASSTAIPSGVISDVLIPTVRIDLENESVTHG